MFQKKALSLYETEQYLVRKRHCICAFHKSVVLRRFNIVIAGLVLSVNLSANLKSQILNDTSTLNLIRRGVDYVYNFQFDQADKVYLKLSQFYPSHPITYLYRGLITYWKDYPLLTGSPGRQSFENDMQQCIELCEKKMQHTDDPEYLMANICARGLLLLFYADNELSMNVLSLAPGTYQYVKKSFDYTGSYKDFYFITGLYNYYREAYPDAHPVYKPLSFLFPKGNKTKGLKEMQIASKDAVFLKAEAYSFLSGIYISFENNYLQAFNYSKSLHELYPANIQYLAVYIKNLLLIKRYDEAENLVRKGRISISNAYFQAQLDIFMGIIYEKKYQNLMQARTYYLKGVRGTEPFGEFAGEYTAYAYFGLSRISESLDDNRNKKMYRKKAMDLADYKNVRFDD
jgi:hypothetical protein